MHLKQESASHSPWATSDLLLALISEVVLEHSHTRLFTCCLWLLLGSGGRAEELHQRPYILIAFTVKNIFYPVLYRISVLSAGLKEWW